MLLQFIAENFLSFKNEIILNLGSSSLTGNEHHIVRYDNNKRGVLRLAALYGANAAGKSNLVNAIHFGKQLILNGTKPGSSIGVRNFKFDNQCRKNPSRLEFIFLKDGKVYHYGFIIDVNRVYEEWLFVKINKRFVRYFERKIHADHKVEFEFGPHFVSKIKKEAYRRFSYEMQGTRENQLFLSEAYNRNIKEVEPIIDWFKNDIEVIKANAKFFPLNVLTNENDNFTNFLSGTLKNCDTGIHSLVTEKREIDFDQYFSDLNDDEKDELKAALDNRKAVLFADDNESFTLTKENETVSIIMLKTVHKDNVKADITLNFCEESEGTQRFVHLIPVLSNVIKRKTFIVDELDRRLHPLLSRQFIKYFTNQKSNNSQLIFTTHESNLLDLSLFRRDEIWFVEKDEKQATHLTSLAEYRIRNDLNIQKGYLNGRFGAIPVFANTNLLDWDND